MTKRLVDIDDTKLMAARAEFGTVTIKDTVDEALTRILVHRPERIAAALDRLAEADLGDRDDAWR